MPLCSWLTAEILRFPTFNYDQGAVSKASRKEIVPLYSRKIVENTYSNDRFIWRGKNYNVEAANYRLTREANIVTKNQLDVFGQVDSLSVTWRKKFMHQLMVKENVIPGIRQKGVLRANQLSTENTLPGSIAGRRKDLWNEESFDGVWKSNPRRRPLIGIMDSILDMPGFQTEHRHSYLIDWSSTNIFAASIGRSLSFYNTTQRHMNEVFQIEDADAYALKWSNDGEKLAMCSLKNFLSVFEIKTQKFRWSVDSCKRCSAQGQLECNGFCPCWSQHDEFIVITCDRVISVYCAEFGILVTSVEHQSTILSLQFSPNFHHLVCSSIDTTIRVYSWPCLIAYLEISYFKPVKALAWHPHECGILCIGGGIGDGSLSLWNINKMDPLSYRRIKFYGAVENLAWNKISGELVVQWSFWEDARTRYTVIPVLASLDRVVDTIPIEREGVIGDIMWNSDQTQIAVHADETIYIWNFFGDEQQYSRQSKQAKPFQQIQLRQNARKRNSMVFPHYGIR